MAAPSVATCLWFESGAEEAARLYAGLLPGGSWKVLNRHMQPDGSEGGAFIVECLLGGQTYILMNAGAMYPQTPAASIQVYLDTQQEVDALWDGLLADGGRENQRGWLYDRWGVSWQVIPRALPRLLALPDRAAAGRVMEAMMGMVKLDIAGLEAAARSGTAGGPP